MLVLTTDQEGIVVKSLWSTDEEDTIELGETVIVVARFTCTLLLKTTRMA